ncbi:arsenate reductase ArsC [Cryobacterium sp. TMT1-3]|uniref:Arsenate reductase ArsC n=1 Tax=Cryobacterium luteum TaxID=1424661 RepID=A0A1H8AB43_9MICO|nr:MULTISPECIES: arsenate reductase ArsC [Cryobacterium]TFB88457.1 arsenate reductase ArsC [Cryobacterium luteum]TFC24483.1 arsenate reductase ArsC [Cryobacterium sp. TMT1-3]SEM67791.1 arsenate reductase [Cryobacterium luteum]
MLPGLSYPEESLRRLAGDLAERFHGIFAAETVERYVLESYIGLLRTSSVKAHLTTRTARFALERLTALAQAKGAITQAVPEVLFVCEQNAGRSQMAAVFTNALSGGAVHVRSAGSMPSSALDPTMVAVMTELGLSLDESFPKPLTDDVVQAADVVITMGCGDACPIYPGKRYVDWELVDPAGQPIDEVRRIRDQIRANVIELLAGLGAPSA